MNSSAEILEIVPIVFGFSAGVLLSLVFFLGLWATVRRLTSLQAGATLLISSFVLRTGFTMIGFYLVLQNFAWQGLASAIVAFTLVRVILARQLKFQVPDSCEIK